MAVENILNSMTMNYFLLAGSFAFYAMLIIQYKDRKSRTDKSELDRDLKWYEYLLINLAVLIAIGLPIVLNTLYDDGSRYMDIGIKSFQFVLSVFCIGWIIYRCIIHESFRSNIDI